MNAVPPFFPPAGQAANAELQDLSLPGFDSTELGREAADPTAMKWAGLHEAAAVVAGLAGLEPGPPTSDIQDFPEMIRKVGGWRMRMAQQGIDDLTAIMEPGIAALLSVNSRGADTSAPAAALWREFHSARGALLALVPPA